MLSPESNQPKTPPVSSIDSLEEDGDRIEDDAAGLMPIKSRRTTAQRDTSSPALPATTKQQLPPIPTPAFTYFGPSGPRAFGYTLGFLFFFGGLLIMRLTGAATSAVSAVKQAWSSGVASVPSPIARLPPVDPTTALIPTTIYTHSAQVPTTWRVLNRIDRNGECFTQGLFFRGRHLYESCGLRAASQVRRVSLAGGVMTVEASGKNPPKDFGEGVCMWPPEPEVEHMIGLASSSPPPPAQLLQLTWQERDVVIWNADTMAPVERIHFDSTLNEGWGITHNGLSELVMSDGSAYLHFWSPDSSVYRAAGRMTLLRAPIKIVDRVKGGADGWTPSPSVMGARPLARDGWAPQGLTRPTRFGPGFGNGGGVSSLNELEWAHGWVLANIWYDTRVAIIHPRSGAVVWYLDFAPLMEENKDGDVLNGLAYTMRLDVADINAREVNALGTKPWAGRLWITGKWWRHVYEIELGGLVNASELGEMGDTVGTGV